jgi:arsenate reductase
MQPHYNVLFICTGNSARSIFAEAILNRKGRGYFSGYSAGAHPRGFIQPQTLQYLGRSGLSTAGLRSKSWDEWAAPGAPEMDFVFTLCDKAAKERCPDWPGHPITGRWSIPDPSTAKGTPAEIEHAFAEAFTMIERRISLFLALPFAKIEQIAIRPRKKTRAAGQG